MADGDRIVSAESPRVRLITNADDFGRTKAINEAVAQAHSRGTLTSASLMVTGEAAADAVRVARDYPSLAVGLHLVVLGGRAASPPADIPCLVDGEGRFSRRPFAAGARYFFKRTARGELAREMRAQFEAFRATGLPLSHVDGHHHMHLHPTVFRLLLPLAREYGAHAIRVSIADELLFSLRGDRRDLALKLGWKIAFAGLGRWCRRSVHDDPIPVADRVYGLMQTGRITETYLVRLLERLVEHVAWAPAAVRTAGTAGATGPTAPLPPTVEIFCHPSLHRETNRLGPNPGDLAALLSPGFKAAIEASGIELTNYPTAYPATEGGRPAHGAPGAAKGAVLTAEGAPAVQDSAPSGKAPTTETGTG